MKKTKLLAGAMVAAIGGLAMTSIASATTTVTPLVGETVTYTLNSGTSTAQVFTAGVLEISGDDTKIFILDRNLGATVAGTGCEDPDHDDICYGGDLNPTYGYHFQWGNNYGFKPCNTKISYNACTTFPNNEQVTGQKILWFSEYANKGYFGNTFIEAKASVYDYWLDSVVKSGNHYDLWGGGYEDFFETWDWDSGEANRQVSSETVKNRQGPCPENFHVPSYGEFVKVFYMMSEKYDDNWTQAFLAFHNDLLFPFAGFRAYDDASVRALGSYAYYWSSSPYSAKDPYSIAFAFDKYGSEYVESPQYRVSAYPVRCFYDSYQTYIKTSKLLVSFWDENGENEIWSGEIEPGSPLFAHTDSGNLVERLSEHAGTKPGYILSGWYDSDADIWYDIDNPITTGLSFRAVWTTINYTIVYDLDGGKLAGTTINPVIYNIETPTFMLNEPIKSGYIFVGWIGTNQDTPKTGLKIFQGTTGDLNFYAVWRQGEVEYHEDGTFSFGDLQGKYHENVGTITITGNNGEMYILMDRNMGATTNDLTKTGSRGYHYQWGNNYGFESCYTNNCNTFPGGESSEYVTVSGAVYNSSYDNKGYYSDTYIKSNSTYQYDYWTDSQTTLHNGLRGGANDTQSNNYGVDLYNPEERQGPCPEGWHVPSIGELNQMVQLWGIEYQAQNPGFERNCTSGGLSCMDNNLQAATSLSDRFGLAMIGLRMTQKVQYIGINGFYLSSSPNTEFPSIGLYGVHGLGISENAGGVFSLTARGFAGSVRCMRDTYPIVYDYNGGTGIKMQTVISGKTGVRPTDPEKFKYQFSGWYDNPEFEGEEFDFENTLITGDITLYAKRERKEITTTLMYGPDFNARIKGLAGTNADTNAINDNIKHFERAYDIPDGVTTGLLSTTTSEIPVYGWFDSTNGTFYWYTEADKIYAPESMWYMFHGFSVLEELDLSEWDTSKTTSMRTAFQECYKLKSINMSGWNTSEVEDMSFMFNKCNSLTHLDLSSFNTSKVTSMRAMFAECYSLEELDLSNFDTSNVTNMKSMFMSSDSNKPMKLKYLDVSSFNTAKVTNMNAMFQLCSYLTGLNLSNWDTSNVTDMSFMFNSCSNIISLDLSGWNTNKLETMYAMFCECSKLEYLNLSGWDTSKVGNMSYTFTNNPSLKILDLHSFDTRNVTNMFGVFGGTTNLETIYASDKFIVNPGIDDRYMFIQSENLVGGNGTKFDENKIKSEYARIDKVGQTGYFTDPNEITVNFISEGELYTGRIAVRSGQVEKPSENPTKAGLIFTNWYEDSGLNIVFDFNKGIMKYTELYAGFGEPQQVGGHSGGGSNGGGSAGGSASSMVSNNEPTTQDPDTTENVHNSAGEFVYDSLKANPNYSDEMNEAYQYAYHYGITTMKNIKEADMGGNLTRIAMAKMLSNYAINVLGKDNFNESRDCSFMDVSPMMDTKYDTGVTKACQLGIMGINMPNSKFRPNDIVTRAEFVTALSRMKYNTPDGTDVYYSTHMKLLNRLGIITNTDPNMKELRGYVMLMLMRAK